MKQEILKRCKRAQLLKTGKEDPTRRLQQYLKENAT